MCRPQPAATELIRACSGGGGALDQAAHQRCSDPGESQARTARIARDQDGGGTCAAGGPPSLSLRRRAPAAVPCRGAAAGDQRTRRPSRS